MDTRPALEFPLKFHTLLNVVWSHNAIKIHHNSNNKQNINNCNPHNTHTHNLTHNHTHVHLYFFSVVVGLNVGHAVKLAVDECESIIVYRKSVKTPECEFIQL